MRYLILNINRLVEGKKIINYYNFIYKFLIKCRYSDFSNILKGLYIIIKWDLFLEGWFNIGKLINLIYYIIIMKGENNMLLF